MNRIIIICIIQNISLRTYDTKKYKVFNRTKTIKACKRLWIFIIATKISTKTEIGIDTIVIRFFKNMTCHQKDAFHQKKRN